VNLIDQAVVGLLPLVPKPIVRRFSSRYIAGDDLASAVRTIRRLNGRRLMATVDVLGEFIHRLDEADATAAEYERVLEAIQSEGLDANISIKLTGLGLLLDREHGYRLVERLVLAAASRGNFVRIDMEDSACTTITLDLYRRLRAAGHDNVGIVLQAYLKRSLDDIEALLPLKPNVRVCKGIYVEPEAIAFKDAEEIRRNYRRMTERLLDAGCYVGMATHDPALVEAGRAIVKSRNLPPSAYEFQMLLGVAEEIRQSLIDAGHRLRVYVPYGAQWYAYSVRRLKENPRIAGYVFRNLMAGR
jgi:proline dehydrogenase